MDFFKKTWVKVMAWILLAISIVILILGGAGIEVITTGVGLVASIVSAVAAFIAFITERTKK